MVFSIFNIPNVVIYLVGFGLTLSTLYEISAVLRLLRAEKLALELAEANRLTAVMRSKHHDVLNYLQVILGLIQLGRVEDAANYIRQISFDLVQMEQVESLGRPEVSALLYQKLSSVSYIRPRIMAGASLSSVPVEPHKLVAILGNLLDYAIYKASFYPNKWITIRVREDKDCVIIEIMNPGDMESDPDLSIAKNTLQKVGGALYFACSEKASITMLIVRLPKSRAA